MESEKDGGLSAVYTGYWRALPWQLSGVVAILYKTIQYRLGRRPEAQEAGLRQCADEGPVIELYYSCSNRASTGIVAECLYGVKSDRDDR